MEEEIVKEFEGSDGYASLVNSLKEDCKNCSGCFPACSEDDCKKRFHNYYKKIMWILARAKHYAEKTGLAAHVILDGWEKHRTYWYMNYYQDCNQSEIKEDNVVVVETGPDFAKRFPAKQFVCPNCDGISTDPQTCNSGKEVNGKVCDWKSYGLFKTWGKGIHVFIKDTLQLVEIFKPVEMSEAVKNET